MSLAIDLEEVFGRPVDPRHDLAQLKMSGDRVSGVVERGLAADLEAWAESRRLRAGVKVVAPRPATARTQSMLSSAPRAGAPAVSEVLLGQRLEAFDEVGDWLRVRSGGDAYLGWLPTEATSEGEYEATHQVVVLRAHLYSSPRVQGRILGRLSWGALLRVTEATGEWLRLELPGGRPAYAAATVLRPVSEVVRRPVLESWREFMGAPYVWGGTSAWGLDCSGFIQTLWRMAGNDIARDSDQQGRAGKKVDTAQAGDLALFPGHIGLCLGADEIVHANASAMAVSVDRISTVIERAGEFSGFVRS